MFEEGQGIQCGWMLRIGGVPTTRIEMHSIAFQQVKKNEGNWGNFTKK